ncbi:MAG: RNA polymerase sigma factor [Candidatus Krumholzibacteriia bacterium]
MNAVQPQPEPPASPGATARPAPAGGPDPLAVAALVRAAQAGDAGAFERLYRLHVGRVYALCLRLAGDTSRAEILTQDVFVRAWRKLTLFAGRSAFSSWLHRLTVNVVMEDMRADARRNGRVVMMEDLSLVEAPGREAPAGAALDLERAIAALPGGARLVFVLHDVQGYRHEEIAALTGLAVGTSKAQLHRARRLLREELA